MKLTLSSVDIFQLSATFTSNGSGSAVPASGSTVRLPHFLAEGNGKRVLVLSVDDGSILGQQFDEADTYADVLVSSNTIIDLENYYLYEVDSDGVILSPYVDDPFIIENAFYDPEIPGDTQEWVDGGTIEADITFDRSSITVQPSVTYKTNTFTATGVYDLTISATGTIDFTETSVSGNTVTLRFKANKQTTTKNGTITVSGKTADGSTYSKSFNLIQNAASGTSITLTINPTPSDATVYIEGVQRKSYTFASGQSIYWIVSKAGYTSQSDTETFTATTTKAVVLEETVGSIKVTPTAYEFNNEAGYINVTTTLENTGTVSITSSQSWCTVNKSSLTTSGVFRLNVADNTECEVRTATVTLTDGKASASIAVTQKRSDACDPYFTLDSSTLAFKSTVDSLYVQVTTNINDPQFSFSGLPSWLSAGSWVQGQETEKWSCKLTSTANNTGSKRTATVTVKSGTLTQTFTVSQPSANAVLTIDPESVEFDFSGTPVQSVTVSSTVTGTFSASAPSWVTITSRNTNGTSYTIQFSCKENTGTADRTGDLIVTQGSNNVRCNITQHYNTTELDTEGTISVGPDGSNAAFTVKSTSTGEFEISEIDIEWLHIVRLVQQGTSATVEYYCDTNTGSARSYTVKLEQNGKEIFVTITQSGKTEGITDLKDVDRLATINYKAQKFTIAFEGKGSIIGTKLTFVKPSWLTVEDQYWDANICIVKLKATATASKRSAIITAQGGSASATHLVVQTAPNPQPPFPVWRAQEVNMRPNGDFLEYHINNVDNELLYAAKAYRFPGETLVSWDLSETCSNYLGNGIEFVEGSHTIPNYLKEFDLVTSTGDAAEYWAYNSWGYEDCNILLSRPIDNRIDPRQWFVTSWLSLDNTSIKINGNVVPPQIAEKSGQTYLRNLAEYVYACGDRLVVEAGDERIAYKFDCGDYVLYYSNAFGGWDSLLCLKSSKKTDNIESFNYRNTSKQKYLARITPTWNLKTGYWLDGTKMHHLLESTDVYLQDLATGKITPVVLTDASCEYKTLANNGRRPYYYEINVEERDLKFRR